MSSRNFLSRTYFQVFPQDQSKSCSFARSWIARCKPPSDSVKVYRDILESQFDGPTYLPSQHQIELDLNRTFPDEPYFSDSGPGQGALRRVLNTFAKYDPQLGYVQGMNFIVAALLWHANEADSFWLFVSLMEDYELRDNYLPNLPGLSKHSQIIDILTLEKMPRLHLHFAQYQIVVEMFATDWCFSLFGSIVPVAELVEIIDKFYKYGWMIFYKMVMVILERLETKLLSSSETVEILSPLKPTHHSQRSCTHFMESMQIGRESFNWKELVQQAEKVDLDAQYIAYLHMNFNIETGMFTHLHSYRPR